MATKLLPIPDIPQGLREAALRGNLIPFIGAGASILAGCPGWNRSEEHTSELQSQSNLACRLLLEKKKPSIGPYAALTSSTQRVPSRTVQGTRPLRSLPAPHIDELRPFCYGRQSRP